MAWKSELALFGRLQATKPQTPMWLNLADLYPIKTSSLTLKKVDSPDDWIALTKLRTEIEIPFGLTEKLEIESIISAIQRIVKNHKASWYLAIWNNSVIGEVGLVEFEQSNFRYGRLLDVDIAPIFQGQGLGNQLIASISNLAQKNGLKAICLKADADRWVKEWYAKLGFLEIGHWKPKVYKIDKSLSHKGQDFRLRCAYDSDVPSIRLLVNSAYKELADMNLNYTATYQDEATTRERMKSGQTFVLVSKQEIVGTVLFSTKNYFTNRHSSYVSQLAILPSFKRTGLGSILMDLCENLTLEEGYEAIQLDTAKPAQHLVNWYIKRGYRIVGETKWEGKTYESWIFEKNIVS